jgi:hypothetical protein
MHRSALRRIKTHVRQGGHGVPKRDDFRRFDRGWENFARIYEPAAKSWPAYDNSDLAPAIGKRETKVPICPKRSKRFAAGVGRALRQAAKIARKTARMHGTPIYIVEDGEIVAERP